MKKGDVFFLRNSMAGGLILWCMSASVSHAGLVVNGTRFVLPAPATSRGVTVENTGKSNILVKSQVVSDPGLDVTGSVLDASASVATGPRENQSPFIITPPLFVLAGGKSNQMRLNCLDCDALPKDRESLFRLSVSAIPAGKAPPNTVQVAIRSSFKLFYRPEGLPGNPGVAYQQLQWRREGRKVSVHNSTPYYVTLFKMKVNGTLLNDPGMVPPFSTRTQAWCPDVGECTIHWRTLDDYGGEREQWVVNPSGTPVLGHSG